MRLLTLTVFLLGGAGCRLAESDPIQFPDARAYVHDLFVSPEECAAAQKVGFINCAQLLTLCPSGDAWFVLTDIRHSASYAIVGSRLTVRVPDSPETRGGLVFEVLDDGTTLRMLPNNTLWVHRRDLDAQAERDCS